MGENQNPATNLVNANHKKAKDAEHNMKLQLMVNNRPELYIEELKMPNVGSVRVPKNGTIRKRKIYTHLKEFAAGVLLVGTISVACFAAFCHAYKDRGKSEEEISSSFSASVENESNSTPDLVIDSLISSLQSSQNMDERSKTYFVGLLQDAKGAPAESRNAAIAMATGALESHDNANTLS